jgi:hypothetical protein
MLSMGVILALVGNCVVFQEWDALDSASAAVKVNLLVGLLGLRVAALSEMRQHVDKLIELGE